MDKKILSILGIMAYIVSFILIIYYFIIEFSILNMYTPLYRVITIIIIIVLTYIGGLLLKSSNIKLFSFIAKNNIYLWFFLYLVMLLNLTLFDKTFNRQFMKVQSFTEYFNSNFNIIPFKTISNFNIALKNHNLDDISFIYNIFGNLLAFSPLSLFLPRIFKKINKWYKYFIVVSMCIIVIEVLQMLFRCGSCDIDDYILNIAGSMCFYFIFNNSLINKICNKYILKRK